MLARADLAFHALTLAVLHPAGEDPGRALALATALSTPAPRRRPLGVPAGAAVELERGADLGPPSLTPAPGGVPGIDEEQAGVRVYRTLAAARLSGRTLAAGSRVLVSHRFPQAGDLAVVVTRRAIRIAATGPGGAVPLPPDGRLLGTVEAVMPA